MLTLYQGLDNSIGLHLSLYRSATRAWSVEASTFQILKPVTEPGLTTDVAQGTFGDGLRAKLTHAWLNPDGLDYALSVFAEGLDFGRGSDTRFTINGLIGGTADEPGRWGIMFAASRRF